MEKAVEGNSQGVVLPEDPTLIHGQVRERLVRLRMNKIARWTQILSASEQLHQRKSHALLQSWISSEATMIG
jgi:hypothetical protein